MMVNGNEVGTYEGIITIFAGFDGDAVIKRFILVTYGDESDKLITLDDCRRLLGVYNSPVTVIFEDWTHGEIYEYGNHGEYWEKVGTTEGFA